ncbi:hypothetical protein COB57_01590 [Candidatus Peregrinibacteria bacterium]|nr:MAG: hypothetical protein COB57_01590 [Candidatus Peregrinibacteria bacterium]
MGEPFVPVEDIQKIQDARKILLEEYDINVKKVEYFQNGREIRLFALHYVLWIDLTKDVKAQLLKFEYAFSQFSFPSIEYIDLRIKDRVIFKEIVNDES